MLRALWLLFSVLGAGAQNVANANSYSNANALAGGTAVSIADSNAQVTQWNQQTWCHYYWCCAPWPWCMYG